MKVTNLETLQQNALKIPQQVEKTKTQFGVNVNVNSSSSAQIQYHHLSSSENTQKIYHMIGNHLL